MSMKNMPSFAAVLILLTLFVCLSPALHAAPQATSKPSVNSPSGLFLRVSAPAGNAVALGDPRDQLTHVDLLAQHPPALVLLGEPLLHGGELLLVGLHHVPDAIDRRADDVARFGIGRIALADIQGDQVQATVGEAPQRQADEQNDDADGRWRA